MTGIKNLIIWKMLLWGKYSFQVLVIIEGLSSDCQDLYFFSASAIFNNVKMLSLP